MISVRSRGRCCSRPVSEPGISYDFPCSRPPLPMELLFPFFRGGFLYGSETRPNLRSKYDIPNNIINGTRQRSMKNRITSNGLSRELPIARTSAVVSNIPVLLPSRWEIGTGKGIYSSFRPKSGRKRMPKVSIVRAYPMMPMAMPHSTSAGW